MLKTVKGKVIAGTVAFGLLSGVGVAFGATDAGAQLQSWYNSQFGKSSSQISTEIENYGKGKIDGLLTEFNGLKQDATTKISDKGENVTDTTNKDVGKRAEEHIASIEKQKAEIEGYLEGQFKDLKVYAEGLINESGKQAHRSASVDITTHSYAVGKDAINTMTKEIEKTTKEAKGSLEETIKNAKAELQDQLDANKNLTIIEIKQLIDNKINELRMKITNLNDALISTQIGHIEDAAAKLLLDAEKELQSIVDSINK